MQEQTESDVQVFYNNFGGSAVSFIPRTEEAYQRLLDANVGTPEGGKKENGFYPSVVVNYPTSTNSTWAKAPYDRVMKALEGFTMAPLHPDKPEYYPIGR